MTDRELLQKAGNFRAMASRVRTTGERDWAVYCAGILEEQAVLLGKTGRCPDVLLPDRPSLHGEPVMSDELRRPCEQETQSVSVMSTTAAAVATVIEGGGYGRLVIEDMVSVKDTVPVQKP